MYIKNLRIGNWVNVDGLPRKVSWLGNTYPRVDIDGVDVACKEDDLHEIPITVYILDNNGWKQEEIKRMSRKYKKGSYTLRLQENGRFLEYSNVITNLRVNSLHQLQNLIDDIEGGENEFSKFEFYE